MNSHPTMQSVKLSNVLLTKNLSAAGRLLHVQVTTKEVR